MFLFSYNTRVNATRQLVRLGTASALISLCLPVYALDPQNRSSVVREQDLQNKIRMQDTINNELKLQKQRAESAAAKTKKVDEIDLDGPAGAKFLVSEIDVDTGAYPRYAVGIKDILSKYQKTEIGSKELFSLVRDVTNRYAEHGYSTTAIGIVTNNMRSGKLTLRIDWGLVEGWHIDGRAPATVSEKLMAMQAMPGAINKPLNIHDIDQAIENLNNTSKLAKIDVVPAERTGYSYLNITTAPNPTPSNTLGMDNSGVHSPSNGRYRYSLSSSFSDVLLGNDTLRLNGSSRRFQDDEENSEHSVGISYVIPVGYSQLEMRYNESTNSSQLAGAYGTYDSAGDSQTYGLKVSHTLFRDATSKLTAFSELERKDSQNYLDGLYLEASSKRYDSLTMGLQHITQLLGGSLYSDLSLSHGMSGLGGAYAAFDSDGKPQNYKKVSFNTAWSRSLKVGEQALQFSSRVGGQYAQTSMISSFKQGIGDEYSVRGFNGPALWGDRAVFLSNTLELPLRLASGQVSPFAGLDAGYVNEVLNVKDYAEDATIAGAVIGVRGSWKHFNASLSVASPLLVPDFIEQSTSPYVTYMSFGVSL